MQGKQDETFQHHIWFLQVMDQHQNLKDRITSPQKWCAEVWVTNHLDERHEGRYKDTPP